MWDVGSEHTIEVHAPPAVVYEKVRTFDMGRSWGIRQLFRLRGLPRDALTMNGLQGIRFALLADIPPRELVLGLIGRFWTPSGRLKRTNLDDFIRFGEPGYAKAVWSFELREVGEKVILSTHTRVLCLDETSRRRFKRYWRVISPFSGWIRRRVLQLIKAESESIT
jgi:hypothetical protein